MEWARQRIERQVFGLTGLSSGTIDYEKPEGDPGLFGPDSLCWRVHSDFPAMLCGGIGALMLQMLHPLALAGVWDHSTFREDMLGRLRRTSQFIAGTTFAATADAQRLIERVRHIHAGIRGTAPDGRPYAADDPDLLTWVHVAEVRSFLVSYQRYNPAPLSVTEEDRYLDEVALIAEALGAREVPRTRQAIDAYLHAMRPQLVFDERAAEVLQRLLHPPAPNRLSAPIGHLMARAGLDLLPEWAQQLAGIQLSAPKRLLFRTSLQGIAPLLRWAIRNGARARARRRLGLDPVSPTSRKPQPGHRGRARSSR